MLKIISLIYEKLSFAPACMLSGFIRLAVKLLDKYLLLGRHFPLLANNIMLLLQEGNLFLTEPFMTVSLSNGRLPEESLGQRDTKINDRNTNLFYFDLHMNLYLGPL